MQAGLVSGRRAGRGGHFGAGQALTAVPAMVGSLLLLVALFGWMGSWEGIVLLAWLASGAAVFTRTGERVAVVVGCGFRRPTRAQARELVAVWSAALARSGVAAVEVDLYVQDSCQLNAYAAGGHSVAVTSGVLRKFLARRLGEDQMVGVLVHELGHHVTRATRFALVSMWLATPWRVASRLLIGLGLATVGRRQPMRLLAAVTATVVVIAVVQAAQHHDWKVAIVLSVVASCAVVCPLADAALSRRSEYAADRFAAEQGAGAQLAAALLALDGRRQARRSWTVRALSGHPSTDRRVDALLHIRASRPGYTHG